MTLLHAVNVWSYIKCCCTASVTVLRYKPCMVWRHGIFPTLSGASPIPTAAIGRRRPRNSDELPTVSDRAYPVAGSRQWNILPPWRHLSSSAGCFPEPHQNWLLIVITIYFIKCHKILIKARFCSNSITDVNIYHAFQYRLVTYCITHRWL